MQKGSLSTYSVNNLTSVSKIAAFSRCCQLMRSVNTGGVHFLGNRQEDPRSQRRNERSSRLAAPHLPSSEEAKAGTMAGNQSHVRQLEGSALERKIADRVPRSIVSEMSIRGENYQRSTIPMPLRHFDLSSCTTNCHGIWDMCNCLPQTILRLFPAGIP